jgi:hypothetical protein
VPLPAAGGWNSEKVRLRKLQPQAVAEEDVFAHSGADAAGRTPLTAVREGQVLRGTVVAQLLHHGAQVDLGAEYDGILPCQDEQWEEAGELLQVGRQVEVTVHRVRDPRLFRFPIHVSGAGRWRGSWPCCWGSRACCWGAVLLPVCACACGSSMLHCQPHTHRPAAPPAPHPLVQLSAVSAELAELIVAPEAHKPPMDLRALTV